MEAKAQEQEKSGSKRKTISEMLQSGDDSQTSKKAKKVGYQLESQLVELIGKDQPNAKLWDECKESLGDTKQVCKKKCFKIIINNHIRTFGVTFCWFRCDN